MSNEKKMFEMTKELKNILHGIEETSGAPKELLNMYGTEWVIACINYILYINKDRTETMQNLHRIYHKHADFERKVRKRWDMGLYEPFTQRDPIPPAIRHEVFKRDNYRCLECGKTNKETTLHLDHIRPVTQGGSDELDNLQTLCETCNIAKSNRAWKGGNNES
ncbi:HNH endonuclease [Methanobacterium spitsbergense]|uniref:HNH endonuclease n=1 Tax=Methanobacterium spitsbergense TaxID=2874285 RepID=A0A8T5UTA5_9EURY|nr:HNH endonuclease [Methanobacterium spitsbergense]MBZ2166988.1 HNH endonuclease [Methanobacterium spitsbergense]